MDYILKFTRFEADRQNVYKISSVNQLALIMNDKIHNLPHNHLYKDSKTILSNKNNLLFFIY